MKEKEKWKDKRYRKWAMVGIIGALICVSAAFLSLHGHNNRVTEKEEIDDPSVAPGVDQDTTIYKEKKINPYAEEVCFLSLIGLSLTIIGLFGMWSAKREIKKSKKVEEEGSSKPKEQGESWDDVDDVWKEQKSGGNNKPKKIQCPSCGKKISRDSNFCTYCGKEVAEDDFDTEMN